MDTPATKARTLRVQPEFPCWRISPKVSIIPFDRHEIFASLKIIQVGPSADIECSNMETSYGAGFSTSADMKHLFPFINSIVSGAQYSRKPDYVRFCHRERLCILYDHEGAFTPFCNYAEAVEFLDRLLEFLDEIQNRSHEIVPDYRTYTSASPLDILRLLPRNNCRECGYQTCLAFAAALARQQTQPVVCPHLPRPVEEGTVYQLVDGEGKNMGTVSLPIDTRALNRKVREQNDCIQALQLRLEELERKRFAKIKDSNSRLISPLSKRELEVLGMLAEGSTNKNISEELYISENTVKTHVAHIFDKLNVNDRVQASVWAVRNGLV